MLPLSDTVKFVLSPRLALFHSVGTCLNVTIFLLLLLTVDPKNHTDTLCSFSLLLENVLESVNGKLA